MGTRGLGPEAGQRAAGGRLGHDLGRAQQGAALPGRRQMCAEGEGPAGAGQRGEGHRVAHGGDAPGERGAGEHQGEPDDFGRALLSAEQLLGGFGPCSLQQQSFGVPYECSSLEPFKIRLSALLNNHFPLLATNVLEEMICKCNLRSSC
jgi:hypothetical protein